MVNDEQLPLSAAAAARMHSLLPDLLLVVQRRRRRRRAAQATAMLVAATLLAVFVWPDPKATAMPAPAPEVASWSTLHDDPTVLSRCEVATVARAAWFVDDDGLQDCLRAAARPSGLVRIGTAVHVDPAAIDVFPNPQTLEPQTLEPQTLEPQTLEPQTPDTQTLEPVRSH